jgi:hypothetical protein
MWKVTEHSKDENVQWAWLRAVEWKDWPLFISQPIVPILFYFYRWPAVIGVVLVITFLWKLTVTPFWVSAKLAYMGPVFVMLKFVTCPTMAYLLSQRSEIPLALVALLWPLLKLPIDMFIMVVTEAVLSLTAWGRAAQTGVVQARFLRAIGFIDSSAPLQTSFASQ